MGWRGPGLAGIVVLAGCAAQPRPAPDDAATVRADPVVSAGLPVQLRLRKAGDVTLRAWQHSLRLAPGPQVFLVDCRVLATGATARFEVRAELEPGGDYRFVAEASAQKCESVELRPR